MKKNGFTLAEVLITLGVIGVVASITIPTVAGNIDRNTWATSLRASQSVLTNGFSQMMAADGVDTLRETTLWDTCVGSNYISSPNGTGGECAINEMKKFFNISSIGTGIPSGVTFRTIHGQQTSIINNMRLDLANGVSAYFRFMGEQNDCTQEECKKIESNHGSMCGQAATIYVDVNGKKGPNVIGKDIYYFFLGPNGRLYPKGGFDHTLYKNKNSGNADTTPIWKENCDGNVVSSSCTSSDLTGRVVEEGYKITYKN